QATAEITEGGHARIIVKPARDDVQYALLETDGSRNPLPDKPVYSWAPPVEGAGSLAFDGLSREVSYAIVARAKDYDEVTYQGQVDAKAFVVVKTPSADFRDVAVGDGSVVRSVDGQTITITNKSPRSQYYMIYDAKTGVAVTDSLHPDGWREFEGNGSGEKPVSVSVDASTAYQDRRKVVEQPLPPAFAPTAWRPLLRSTMSMRPWAKTDLFPRPWNTRPRTTTHRTRIRGSREARTCGSREAAAAPCRLPTCWTKPLWAPRSPTG
ncbi:MAG: hypothetical protein ACLSVD_08340, partial [Eggerthellaceae bacterium]